MSTGISGTDGASEDGSSIFEKIADATMEVTVQPHSPLYLAEMAVVTTIGNEGIMRTMTDSMCRIKRRRG